MRYLLCVIFIMALNRCSNKEQFRLVQAPRTISESFEVSGDGRAEPHRISILKSALEKEFLLQGNVIGQTVAPTGHAVRSRIVAFRKINGKLAMLEATQGHVVTQELPSTMLLSQFPITGETEQYITFDFNEGMTKVFSDGDWHVQDFEGRNYFPATSYAKLQNSYVESAKLTAENQLVIRQIAQVEMSGFFGGNRLDPIEIRYFLEPYHPDPNFVPTALGEMRLSGFFEVAPRLESNGSTTIYGIKHQTARPIVFAVSPNTPKEYREAVRQGILYWNSAMPNSIIQAIDAPEGVSAPDTKYNVIQWVNHDTAGSAYADMQMDPRTGQILHAQAYITSAFAFSGVRRARGLLRRLKSGSRATNPRIIVPGFQVDTFCNFEPAGHLVDSLTDVLARGPSHEQLLRLSQDYVRTVVAHEVGHLLGLRHNFSGSLHTENYDFDKKEIVFDRYIEKAEVDRDVTVSSSVMDYSRFEEDALIGHGIAHGHSAMQYDQKALSVLYSGKTYTPSSIPPFCTDSDIGSFIDCERFDVGSSVVESALLRTEGNLRRLPNTLLESYIAHKAPAPGGEPRGVESLSLNPNEIASAAYSLRNNLVTGFDKHTHLLTIYRLFDYTGPLNDELINQQEQAYLLDQIDHMGGMDRFFQVAETQYFDQAKAQFEKLVRSSSYQSGDGAAGQAYTFDESEIKTMTQTVTLLMNRLPKSIAKVDLEMLKGIPSNWKASNSKLGNAVAKVLSARMQRYALQQTGAMLEVEIEFPEKPLATELKNDEEPAVKHVKANLPMFFYNSDQRKIAAALLTAPTEPESIGWAFAERTSVKTELLAILNTACGCDIEKIQTDKIKAVDASKSNQTARWFLENKQVLGEIK